MRLPTIIGASIFCLLGSVNLLASDDKKTTRKVETSQSGKGPLRLVERVVRSRKATDSVVIPYERYVLANGLTIILHEDKSDPLVHVDVTYRAGSSREEIGKSGFAHFFEHMMFQGSQNVADEEHFKTVNEAGGSFNGTTTNDRTNYYQTIPKNHLERILWLEADRMGFLLPAVTQKKFEVQRATVKNERSQNVEGRPYGLVGERVFEALYPEGHPYSWLPIGYTEDLDRVDINDLKAFFNKYYGPNNVTLTIAGDLDKAKTLGWIGKYFGTIPRGSDVQRLEKPTMTLAADRYVSIEDNVTFPLLYMVMPTVSAFHEDEAPLDVLTTIIGGGETSLLYANLVKTGLALEASSGHECLQLACTFSIQALPNSNSKTSLADLERIIRATLAQFEERGANDGDVARLTGQITAAKIFGLESASGKATQLAFYDSLFGTPNLIQADIARYRNVTKADVMRVYGKYIKGKAAVIMSAVPKGQLSAIAAPDSWTRAPRKLPEFIKSADVVIAQPVIASGFDRNVKPEPGPRPALNPLKIWRNKAPGGVAIIGTVSNEVPTTTLQFQIAAGQRHVPLDKLGLAGITAAMMNRGTRRSSLEEIGDRLRKLGSQVAVNAGFETVNVSVRTLTANLDQSLAIASEMLFEPKFSPEEFDLLKAQVLQGIASSSDNQASVTNRVMSRLLYGDSSILAYPGSGTAKTVETITLDDVKRFYEDMVLASSAEIVVVSDLPRNKLVRKLGKLGTWKAKRKTETSFAAIPDPEAATIYLVDRPGAAQSDIRVFRRTMTFDATGAHFKAKIMNYPLGGDLGSRLAQNIREDKGYTYGVEAGFAASKYDGTFTTATSVRADVTGASIKEIRKELDSFANDGMTAAELEFTRNTLLQGEALAYETPGNKGGFLASLLAYDLQPDYVAEQKQIVETIKLDEIRKLAETYLRADSMTYLVVGDKQTVKPQLEALAMPIIEIYTSPD